MKNRQFAALDDVRLLAAVLVVAIHTSPLASYSGTADFLLTRVVGRIAVPFFFMTTGHFLSRNGWQGLLRFWKRMAALYGAAILLYLPLNLYMGGFTVSEGLRKLLAEGTLYHLWYFPAVLLGTAIAAGLSRLGMRAAIPAAFLLYLIGLGGDSYYGLAVRIPGLQPFYDVLFCLFDHTRNGIFFAPLFLLLGEAGWSCRLKVSVPCALASLTAMSGEALLLRGLGVQRHDSMYLLLPLVMVFLFSLLLQCNRGRNPAARRSSLWIYLLHPWVIVLVRGAAELLGWERWLVDNSLLHFLAVLLGSAAAAAGLQLLRPDPVPAESRAWREVDLGALRHNVRLLQRRLQDGCRLMAVVKADAYGHGAKGIARALQREGVHAFAVACLQEAETLRRAGIRGEILILGYTPPELAPRLARSRATQTVLDAEYAAALAAQRRRIPVHLAVDTGMHRFGVRADEPETLRGLYALPYLRFRGMFTHLCVPDSLEPADLAYTQRQVDSFWEAADTVRSAGDHPGKLHLQASYAVWNLPPQPCAYARIGTALYGVRSDRRPVLSDLELRPVLSLRARVASVRRLEAGEAAGYGLLFRAERTTRLAVVSIGYADGLPRDLAQRGAELLLRGKRAPIVGRVCMDQLMADVTDVPEACSGDTATIIGQDGEEGISAEDLAERCGTITNELLSRLSPRLGIVYRENKARL